MTDPLKGWVPSAQPTGIPWHAHDPPKTMSLALGFLGSMTSNVGFSMDVGDLNEHRLTSSQVKLRFACHGVKLGVPLAEHLTFC